MRTRFDQFGKRMVRDALEGHCLVESEVEVPAETRRIDLLVTPRDAREVCLDHLGLLGRITSGSVTLELFHNTPSGDELYLCLIKHGQFRNLLSRRKAPPPFPVQWVISPGRPHDGVDSLGFHPSLDGLRGIYECPPRFCTRLIVVNELPVTPDTLLVRLLGAGSVLKQAIAELQVLPAQAPERTLALPILLDLRLTVPREPARQTADDQEFLMRTYPLVEAWRREAIEQGVEQGVQQGVQQGVEQGERKLLLRQLRRRFGAEVDGAIEERVVAASAEQVELWAERVLSAATLDEILRD